MRTQVAYFPHTQNLLPFLFPCFFSSWVRSPSLASFNHILLHTKRYSYRVGTHVTHTSLTWLHRRPCFHQLWLLSLSLCGVIMSLVGCCYVLESEMMVGQFLWWLIFLLNLWNNTLCFSFHFALFFHVLVSLARLSWLLSKFSSVYRYRIRSPFLFLLLHLLSPSSMLSFRSACSFVGVGSFFVKFLGPNVNNHRVTRSDSLTVSWQHRFPTPFSNRLWSSAWSLRVTFHPL